MQNICASVSVSIGWCIQLRKKYISYLKIPFNFFLSFLFMGWYKNRLFGFGAITFLLVDRFSKHTAAIEVKMSQDTSMISDSKIISQDWSTLTGEQGAYALSSTCGSNKKAIIIKNIRKNEKAFWDMQFLCHIFWLNWKHWKITNCFICHLRQIVPEARFLINWQQSESCSKIRANLLV